MSATTVDTAPIKKALQRSGMEWIFSYWGADEAKHLERARRSIERFRRAYRSRFGETPDPYELLEENPAKGAAFFQLDALLCSVEMKMMIWRIFLGCEIVGLDFRYRAGKPPQLVVRLRSPGSGDEETYLGQEADDFRVLRHFGFVSNGDQLFLQGYFPFTGK